jgi:ABC-2 type transport system permease protein
MRWVVYWSLFVACFKMFVRNRAALFFSLFVPLLIMLIFGVLNFGGTTNTSLGLVDEADNPASHALVSALAATPSFKVTPGDRDAELAELKLGNRDLVLVIPAGYQGSGSSGSSGLVAYSNQSKPEQAQIGGLLLNAVVGQVLAGGAAGSRSQAHRPNPLAGCGR